MNFINVVSTKTLEKGFVLIESEYRRIIQLIEEQMKKVENSQDAKMKFVIMVENGTIAESNDVDSIFNLENTGSQKIIMLGVEVDIKDENKVTSGIKLIFTNPNSENNKGAKPIKYSIKGLSRDWVMVSTSLIEERLQKVTKKNIKESSIKLSGLTLITMVFVTLGFFALNKTNKKQDTALSIIDGIEKQRKNADIDLLDTYLKIEKSKLIADKDYNNPDFLKYFPIFFFLILILMIWDYEKTFSKYFLPHAFVWGEYIDEYDRLQKRKRLVINILIFTILLGVIINLLSNVIWNHFTK